jgi:hypothetical protein
MAANPDILNSFVRDALRRVRAIPGVEFAAITTDLPVTHSSRPRVVNIEDRPDESGKGLFVEVTSATPEYFKVLQASPEYLFFTSLDFHGQVLG